ncbi:MAG TPA: hypothetical protein VM328_03885 [Fimbriimonadaceae bacterium]|nr:hypothetical protein [Fimbriimonadaceae bacterium]
MSELPYDPADYPPGPVDRCYGCWLDRRNGEAAYQHAGTGRYFCHSHTEAIVSWEIDGLTEWAEEGYPDDETHTNFAGMTGWTEPRDEDPRWPPAWLVEPDSD